jgi:flagellar basal-body rod protein FlgG
MRALFTASTGMAAQELNVQVISNNIANMQTTGYKKQRAAFQDLIYDHVRRVGAQASEQGTMLPVGIDIGGGVQTVGTPRSMGQGTLLQTGNTLDVAINGTGFFKIQMPDGTYQYTRDGTFQMDATGRIVNAQGNPVQPTITIPPNSTQVTINAQGQVSVVPPGTSSTPTSSIVGQLLLTRFINDGGLQPVGNNNFVDTPASGVPQDGIATLDGYGTLTQGSLEQANVDVVTEISNLIGAQRAYEMNAKVITAADQMMQSTTQMFS